MIGASLLALLLAASPDSVQVIDSFDRLTGWSAHPADGVALVLRSDVGRRGRALRLDFGFSGGGYAIARKPLSLALQGNYAFSFWIKGVAAPNTLEFKFVDKSGENVWWYTERNRRFTGAWEKVTVRKRQISFAWGPKGGGDLSEIAAIELVITAGTGGGKGSVWFDDLVLRSLPDAGPYALTPVATASAVEPGHAAEAVLDGNAATSWRAGGPRASMTLDFLRSREFGGVSLLWERDRAPKRLVLLASDDGTRWRTVESRNRAVGSTDHFYLPDSDARYLRVDLEGAEGGAGFGLTEFRIESLEGMASRNAFFAVVAGDAPRGSYPRYLLGQRSDWTVVGADGARDEALLGIDGALEAGTGAFTVEPFLFVDGQLQSWNDAEGTPSLAEGRLPIPIIERRIGTTSLRVTAFARGTSTASSVVARYRVQNRGTARLKGTLYLAVRPFQVNPPWQFLGVPGGVSRIDSIVVAPTRVLVNGNREVHLLSPPAALGASTFAAGDASAYMEHGTTPSMRVARDPFGAASAVLAWPIDLSAAMGMEIAIEIPFGAPVLPKLASSGVDGALQREVANWAAKVDRASVKLPGSGGRISSTIASTLGYILINRDGAALQPGSRSYERSWIRDGALTSTALLRFGHSTEVKEFLLWYARYLYPNGKVPCCVDRRGADPVPEHDSHGEFIYLAMEYFRHTADTTVLRQLWPKVDAAVGYLDSLRVSRRTAEYQSGENRLYYGLLPPSISHEGYSAKPMHSYWDDFFALRGLKDAAAMAEVLGRRSDAVRIGTIRDQFATDLYASIDAVMKFRKIDFIPGAADLGDFDATSTTIAISPVDELPRLPRAALERTFERYFTQASARYAAGAKWDGYTPYELRTVGAMLRLGWKERALTMLDAFLADQEPAAWNQWPEVVWPDRRTPKFIGDLPHTWVGSDFLRSAADLFVYERDVDSTLVVGAGIRGEWLEGDGVIVDRLSTWWGTLSYTARRNERGTVVSIAPGVRVPAGGIVLHTPGERPIRRITVNGVAVSAGPAGTVTLRALPATIVFES